ncbi:MAG: 50S ribosomal protein L1 [Spirochaetes bacterium GWF1_41_5]|nr:MAG: 50S ribosomal protein L1 [Spirochaetes bacterium GWF1_41_5]HBE01055.1 50S ribosomal protein L1 [Spirochaetia bacterium]
MKHSKRYNLAAETIEKGKPLPVDTAVQVIKSKATCKFNESLDVSINLNLQQKHSIRDTVSFPHSFGKSSRVVVFAAGDKIQEAKDAGADFAGSDELIQKITDGWLDFDIAVATPDMMKSISKIAKILGTRGLMPNPKAKTVTEDIKNAVKEIKKGRKEVRADKAGIINMSIAKADMNEKEISENLRFLLDAVKRKRPSDLKGDYIKSVTLTSTMGPGVRIDFKSE